MQVYMVCYKVTKFGLIKLVTTINQINHQNVVCIVILAATEKRKKQYMYMLFININNLTSEMNSLLWPLATK